MSYITSKKGQYVYFAGYCEDPDGPEGVRVWRRPVEAWEMGNGATPLFFFRGELVGPSAVPEASYSYFGVGRRLPVSLQTIVNVLNDVWIKILVKTDLEEFNEGRVEEAAKYGLVQQHGGQWGVFKDVADYVKGKGKLPRPIKERYAESLYQQSKETNPASYSDSTLVMMNSVSYLFTPDGKNVAFCPGEP